MSDLFREHASTPYNNIGMHLPDIYWMMTSSEATRRTSSNILLAVQ